MSSGANRQAHLDGTYASKLSTFVGGNDAGGERRGGEGTVEFWDGVCKETVMCFSSHLMAPALCTLLASAS